MGKTVVWDEDGKPLVESSIREKCRPTLYEVIRNVVGANIDGRGKERFVIIPKERPDLYLDALETSADNYKFTLVVPSHFGLNSIINLPCKGKLSLLDLASSLAGELKNTGYLNGSLSIAYRGD